MRLPIASSMSVSSSLLVMRMTGRVTCFRLGALGGSRPPQSGITSVFSTTTERGQGVAAVRHRRDGVALLLEEADVRLQQVDLVVGPQDAAAEFVGHGSRDGAGRRALGMVTAILAAGDAGAQPGGGRVRRRC